MFNLDLAVHEWCSQVLRSYSIKNRKIDELKDHLYCLIDAKIEDGIEEQSAFNEAIAEIGNQDELKAQYDKDLTLLNKLCTLEYGSIASTSITGETIMKKYKYIQISQAILWAAAILACALVLRGTEQAYTVTMLILLPLAVASLISIRRPFSNNKNG